MKVERKSENNGWESQWCLLCACSKVSLNALFQTAQVRVNTNDQTIVRNLVIQKKENQKYFV
jgi:hypothetical protein